MNNEVYHINNLVKTYKNGVIANDKISIDIYHGETMGFLGPNGAGKTTFIKQIVGLLRPTEGDIKLFGNDVVAKPQIIPEYVAYLPQTLVSLDDFYVNEAIYYTGIFRGLTRKLAKSQTNDLLEMLAIPHLAKRIMRFLSGGQKQLVAIACVLIGYRPVIVLDEPTNNLDPIARRSVWGILHNITKKYTAALILVTHNVLEAEQVLGRVAIIDGGKIIALGTPDELKRQIESTVRIEFYYSGDIATKVEDPNLQCLTDSHYRIISQQTNVHSIIDNLINKIGLNNMTDLHIIPPSLEDVYIALNGKDHEFT